jgi:hypothetical protein
MSRFAEPSDRPLAVLWVDGEEVRMVASPADAVTGILASTGAVFRDGFAVFGFEHLEQVCSELDRGGVLWAVDRRFAPRSWAEMLFLSLPEDLHPHIYHALKPVLEAADADHDAVLELAWRTVAGSAAAG